MRFKNHRIYLECKIAKNGFQIEPNRLKIHIELGKNGLNMRQMNWHFLIISTVVCIVSQNVQTCPEGKKSLFIH